MNFLRKIMGGAFCVHWIYGLATGFFIGQAFIIVLLVKDRLAGWQP